MKKASALASLLVALCAPLVGAAQQPAEPPPSSDIVEILADSQQKAGDVYLLRGNVIIHYRGMTLTADEVRYFDLLGNRNARLDLGDFLAWVRATGVKPSAELLARVTAAAGARPSRRCCDRSRAILLRYRENE